jgi:hypothetical protein
MGNLLVGLHEKDMKWACRLKSLPSKSLGSTWLPHLQNYTYVLLVINMITL